MGQYVQESYSAFVQYSDKNAIRICGKVNYGSLTRPLFYEWKTLAVYDIVHFKSIVFMFKVFANILPANLLSFLRK